jgi:hypothetical protein
MKITAKRYINSYDGFWEECNIEEVDLDDYNLYVDGKLIRAGELIKMLLERLGEVK